MLTDNWTILYQAIQRTYRNTVVGLLRDRLNASYPTDAETRVKALFKEWPELESNSRAPRDRQVVSTPLRDAFDVLSVNHFYTIFEKYFKDVAPASLMNDPNGSARKGLLSYLSAVKLVRDPMSHPPDDDITAEDAAFCMGSAHRALTILGFHEAAQTIRDLQTQLSGPLGGGVLRRDPIAIALPTEGEVVSDFVGRYREIASLQAWLFATNRPVWVLAGEGGTGKSSVAFEFARQVALSPPDDLQLVAWVSAKVRRFVEGETVPVASPDFGDLDSAVAALLNVFGESHPDTPDERTQLLLGLLRLCPALIVVDDVDSLTEDNENVVRFFAGEVPATTRSRVLFTSRRRIFGYSDVTTYVQGFDPLDADAFIDSRVRRYSLDPKSFSADARRQVLAVTDASPLYLEDLMRLARMSSIGEAIKRWRDHRGEAARRYALEREVELLNPFARQVLIAASIADGAVAEVDLQAITGLSADATASAIGELQRLFLVPSPRTIADTPAFELNSNTRRLVRVVFGTSDLYRRTEANVRARLGQASHASKDVRDILRRVVYRLQERRPLECETLLLGALEQFPEHPDLLDFLGRTYAGWVPRPKLVDARKAFHRAAELKCLNEAMYYRWAQMEAQEKEWTRAADAAEWGLRVHGDSKKLRYQAGYAHSQLGQELQRSQQFEKSKRELRAADEFLREAARVQGNDEMKPRLLRALFLNADALDDVKQVVSCGRRIRQECAREERLLQDVERVFKRRHLNDEERIEGRPQ